MSSLPSGRPAIHRQHPASDTHSNLAPAAWQLQPYLDAVLPHYPNVEKVSNSQYRNHRHRIIFDRAETTGKSFFRRWLAPPALHVIDDGHARIDRGPCFGRVEEGAIQTEDWDEGNNRATSGLCRMGLPFLGIEAAEILEHGYTAHLLKESIPAPADCQPQLRPDLPSLHPSPPWPTPRRPRRPPPQPPTRRPLLGLPPRPRSKGHSPRRLAKHHEPPSRMGRHQPPRYAHWATDSFYAPTMALWIAKFITYQVESAFASSEPSLNHAVTRTNRQLRAHGYSDRII